MRVHRWVAAAATVLLKVGSGWLVRPPVRQSRAQRNSVARSTPGGPTGIRRLGAGAGVVALLAAAMIAVAPSAFAAESVFETELTASDPTFEQRPGTPPTHYAAFCVTVSSSGYYYYYDLKETGAYLDAILYVYEGTFNPLDPLLRPPLVDIADEFDDYFNFEAQNYTFLVTNFVGDPPDPYVPATGTTLIAFDGPGSIVQCGGGGSASPIPAWVQAYGRSGPDATCEDGWNPSWQSWAEPVTGGWVCTRSIPVYGN